MVLSSIKKSNSHSSSFWDDQSSIAFQILQNFCALLLSYLGTRWINSGPMFRMKTFASAPPQSGTKLDITMMNTATIVCRRSSNILEAHFTVSRSMCNAVHYVTTSNPAPLSIIIPDYEVWIITPFLGNDITKAWFTTAAKLQDYRSCQQPCRSPDYTWVICSIACHQRIYLIHLYRKAQGGTKYFICVSSAFIALWDTLILYFQFLLQKLNVQLVVRQDIQDVIRVLLIHLHVSLLC